jgi:uncharacterized damage-inducible protein DinB
MSDLRTEQANREADAWAEFEEALSKVPRERWEESEVLPGWSVKELLWHMAGWLQKCSRRLDEMRTGEQTPPSGQSVDERNDELAAESRTMTVDAVYDGLLTARERVRRAWDQLAEIDEAAIHELADETYEHYDEHRADLERFSPA